MTADEKHASRTGAAAFRTLADGLRDASRPLEASEEVEHDVAVIDIAGFVADLKDHAVEHGFHVHDERHFVESYSLRQNWEVDLHPEEGCEGPVDLYLSLEIDPRVLLGFEDAVIERGRRRGPARRVPLPAQLHVGAAAARPAVPTCCVLATELAARGGPDLPLEVSAIDSIPEATDAPERSLRIVAHQSVSLLHIRDGDAVSCEVLDRCLEVSRYLLEQAARLARAEAAATGPARIGQTDLPCRCGPTAGTTRAAPTATARSCGSAASTSRPRRRGAAPTTAWATSGA